MHLLVHSSVGLHTLHHWIFCSGSHWAEIKMLARLHSHLKIRNLLQGCWLSVKFILLRLEYQDPCLYAGCWLGNHSHLETSYNSLPFNLLPPKQFTALIYLLSSRPAKAYLSNYTFCHHPGSSMIMSFLSFILLGSKMRILTSSLTFVRVILKFKCAKV